MINYILILLGGMCVCFSGIMLAFQFTSNRTKRELIKLELITGIMLLLTVLEREYDGVPGTLARWFMKISSFGVALSISLETVGFNAYLISELTEKGSDYKNFRRLRIGFAISVFSIFLVLISQVTGILYEIDDGNRHVRGPLISLNYALLLGFGLLMMSVVAQFRRFWKCKKTVVLLISIFFPVVGGTIQFLFPKSELLCVGFGLSAVMVFTTTLLEQNNYLVQAYYTEIATGFLNYQGYIAEIEKRIASRNICDYDAFYLDIKNMTRINQIYGNDTGNQVLKAFGDYIRAHMAKDEVLGRLGGNYFVALVRKENSVVFLEMLKGIPVEIPAAGEKKTILVSAAAGGYSITDNHISADRILGQTSIAVNIAKHTLNRSCVFLTPELQKEYDAAKQLEQEIKNGLEKGEFVPFYQPKVYAGSHSLSGAEVLVRWMHDGKMIPPGRFIPVMEKDGSICQLDF